DEPGAGDFGRGDQSVGVVEVAENRLRDYARGPPRSARERHGGVRREVAAPFLARHFDVDVMEPGKLRELEFSCRTRTLECIGDQPLERGLHRAFASALFMIGTE